MNPMKNHLTIKALVVTFALSGIAAAADDKPTTTGLRAQGARQHDPEAVFKRIDTNGDGKITKDEFEKAGERLRERRREHGTGPKAGASAGNGKIGSRLFERLDTNKDGTLSLEEFKKLGELRHRQGNAGSTPKN
jgi:hypothetical protein